MQSARWVHALFYPPNVAPANRSGIGFAGRLQFCTPRGYRATHSAAGGVIVAGSAGCGAGDSDATLLFASPRDPPHDVACFEYGPYCAAEHVTVRIPRNAVSNAGGDHHLAVIDEAAGRECDFWETGWVASAMSTGFVTWARDLRIGNGGCGPLRSDGSGKVWQATGSSVPLSAGLLRALDLLGPRSDGRAGKINHALYASIPCAAQQFEYPASGSDGRVPGCAPEGARFFLTDAGLRKFERRRPAIPDWERTLIRAYHDYGLIVSDHGGDTFSFLLEGDPSATLYGLRAPWGDRFIAFASHDPATRAALIDLTVANDVYHVNLAVPSDIAESDWAFAAPCVNRGNC